MRRYLPLMLISLFLVVLVFIGTALLGGTAGHNTTEKIKTVVVYSSLPVEEVSALAQEYEKISGIRVNIIAATPATLVDKVKAAYGSKNAADLIFDDRLTLKNAKKNKLLAPYTSENTDVIPSRFCDADNFWVGLWYDPVIFAVNSDWLGQASSVPGEWSDLATFYGCRLVMTDFLAAEASANLLYSLVAVHGENPTLRYFAHLHANTIQYAKLLVTPPRMVGLGEADIAIAVQSETLRYVNDGFPIKIIYPSDGTAYMLTGVALASGAPNETEAKAFIEWLLQDAAQDALRKNRFYFVPTNPDVKALKAFNVQALQLFEYDDNFSAEEKARLLDKWVQDVRLGPR